MIRSACSLFNSTPRAQGPPEAMHRRLAALSVAAILAVVPACGGMESIAETAAEDGMGAAAQEGIGDAVDEAVSEAVEARMEEWLAGFTEPMLFQLAYTQVFHMGGFGVGVDDFAEGEGTVWEIRSTDADGDAGPPITGERALLEHVDDGTSWWYLRYETPEQPPVEYEVRMDAAFQAHEMYIRDPETGDVRHHEFDHDAAEEQEREASEEELDEAGLNTDYTHLEDWGEYRQERVSVDVQAGTYDADLLVYVPPEEEGDYEFRWWVNPEIPGHLVQYHHEDLGEGGELMGELVEHRTDYVRTLSN